jgi:hypothetical protein
MFRWIPRARPVTRTENAPPDFAATGRVPPLRPMHAARRARHVRRTVSASPGFAAPTRGMGRKSVPRPAPSAVGAGGHAAARDSTAARTLAAPMGLPVARAYSARPLVFSAAGTAAAPLIGNVAWQRRAPPTAARMRKSSPTTMAALPRETRAAARAVTSARRGRSALANAVAALEGHLAATTAVAVIVVGTSRCVHRGPNAAMASAATTVRLAAPRRRPAAADTAAAPMKSASPHLLARDVARKTRPHAARVASTRAADQTRPAATRTQNLDFAAPAGRPVATQPVVRPQVAAARRERCVATTDGRAARPDDPCVD